MAKVSVSFEVEQADKDLIDAVVQLIKDKKAGKSIAEIVSIQIPNVIKLLGESGEVMPVSKADGAGILNYLLVVASKELL